MIGRARCAWLARDVPVAVAADGAVREDRLDIVFEKPGGLVIMRVETGAADDASHGLSPDALTRALDRPVREVLVLDLAGA